MKTQIPDFATKSELFDYLRTNKAELIEAKKAEKTHTDTVCLAPLPLVAKGKTAAKANDPITEDVDELRVKVVANTANWLDQDMDVLLPDAARKSIEERKGNIPHIHDHIHKAEAKIGDVADILLQDLNFSEIGIEGEGSTQCIVFITDVFKELNENIFKQYKRGIANQHSIGLRYVKVDLAINDPNATEEFAIWEKFFDQIINPEMAIKLGFFWAVSEFKLIENSTVLFGSNSKTPTLANDLSKATEPEQDKTATTPDPEPEPQEATTQKAATSLLYNLLTKKR